MKQKFIYLLIAIFLANFLPLDNSSRYNDFCDLEGYTMVGCTNTDDDFEGEDGDIVKMDNGMVFELSSFNYNYAYRPEVAIFAKIFEYSGREIISYKLIVEGDVYEAEKIK